MQIPYADMAGIWLPSAHLGHQVLRPSLAPASGTRACVTAIFLLSLVPPKASSCLVIPAASASVLCKTTMPHDDGASPVPRCNHGHQERIQTGRPKRPRNANMKGHLYSRRQLLTLQDCPGQRGFSDWHWRMSAPWVGARSTVLNLLWFHPL